jgi:hypothetical protein
MRRYAPIRLPDALSASFTEFRLRDDPVGIFWVTMLSKSRLVFRVAVWCLCPLLSGVAQAQPVGDRDQRSGASSLEIGSSFGAELIDGAGTAWGKIDVTHIGVSLTHRHRLSDGRTGLSWEMEYDRYELDAGAGGPPLPDRAHSLALQTTARRPLNERWILLASLKPMVANAGNGFDNHGFGLTAGLFSLYRSSRTLTWGAGLLYRSLAEDDLRILPALGVEWRPAPAWRVDVGFPRTAITYSTNDRWRWSLSANGHGGTFHVGESIAAPVMLENSLLDYTEIRTGFGFEYEPRADLIVSLTVGAIVHQEFDYFERGYEIEADNTPTFVRVGVTWGY